MTSALPDWSLVTERNPHLIRLPHLDQQLVHREAMALWDDALAGTVGPEERLLASATLVKVCNRTIDRLRPERDALAVSLALYDGAKAMDKVIGVARTRFHALTSEALCITDAERAAGWRASATRKQIAARARRNRVYHHEPVRASQRVVRISHQVAVAEEAASLGREVRDRAANELMAEPYNWMRAEVAAMVGLNPSRLSHIAAEARQ